jgi:hypothetical protein
MARPFADSAVMELPFARPGREDRRGKPLALTGLGIDTALTRGAVTSTAPAAVFRYRALSELPELCRLVPWDNASAEIRGSFRIFQTRKSMHGKAIHPLSLYSHSVAKHHSDETTSATSPGAM